MPGLKKSLKRSPPGSRIIEFAGMARGVQTATDEAIRIAITTARGSAPSVLAIVHHTDYSIYGIGLGFRF